MTVSKTSAATSVPRGIRMPTHDEMVAAYKSIVDARMKGGHLKPLAKAPANFSKYPSYDISGGKLGVGKMVYNIKGELYLKTQVVAPNAKPVWYKTGPAPMF
jgi:hypothetical protein